MSFASRPLSAIAGAIVVALAAGTSGLASPALAAPSAARPGRAAARQGTSQPTGPVLPKPASGTPALVKTTSVQTIRQIVQCGGTMFAVGHVWKLEQNGSTFNRDDVFSFSATAPYAMTTLKPDVVGQVNSIAFVDGNCADAYIGGSFTSVNGTSETNIAEIDATTGAVVSGFGHDANNEVDTLLGLQNDQLLVGGKFTELNGTNRNYFDSVSATTGLADPYVNLHITGHVYGMAPVVYNQQLSHGGTLDLVEGNFETVGGVPRQQIFMLNLAGTTATVTGWTSSEFSQHCIGREAFYVRSAAWSPDDSTVYVADTGDHPLTWNRKFPLYGLCDAAAAFSASQTSVSHEWVEYTGCDSYYSVAADDGAVYVGGHPRWAENQNGCNKQGPGGIPDPGLQGLNPAAGTLLTNSSGGPEYHMSRANADSMLITPAGLWIASTNRYGSQACDGPTGHAGICFLSYPTS
jgi:hypothetical protein